MEKKVGILTLHYSNNNFGAVIQAYSVYNLIKSLGHDPHLIDFKPSQMGLKVKVLNFLTSLAGYKFQKFREDNISKTLRTNSSFEDLQRLNSKLDVFTVGSDQVWRYREDEESLKRFYLDFADDKKPKIAIAASFGLENWTGAKDITTEIKFLAQRFTAISVREESAIKICNNEFNVAAVRILDPTMLIDQKLFHSLADKSNLREDGKYLAYMLLDHSIIYEQYFITMANTKKLKYKKIKGTQIMLKPDIWLFNSISKWLDYLRKSDFIVTDSFHCVVFSMIFRKKFICLANPDRGISRLKNLLKMVGLEDRFITSLDDRTIYNAYYQEIDYDHIWAVLDKEKKYSLDFLRTSLSK